MDPLPHALEPFLPPPSPLPSAPARTDADVAAAAAQDSTSPRGPPSTTLHASKVLFWVFPRSDGRQPPTQAQTRTHTASIQPGPGLGLGADFDADPLVFPRPHADAVLAALRASSEVYPPERRNFGRVPPAAVDLALGMGVPGNGDSAVTPPPPMWSVGWVPRWGSGDGEGRRE